LEEERKSNKNKGSKSSDKKEEKKKRRKKSACWEFSLALRARKPKTEAMAVLLGVRGNRKRGFRFMEKVEAALFGFRKRGSRAHRFWRIAEDYLLLQGSHLKIKFMGEL